MIIEKVDVCYFARNVMVLARQQNWKKIFSQDEIFNAFKINNFLKYSTSHEIAKEIPDNKLCQSSAMKKNSNITNDKLAKNLSLDIEVKTLLDKHPKLLAHHKRSPCETYILDRTVAKNVYKAIESELEESADFLFEINPGPGIMTEMFLQNGVNSLRVFENTMDFLPYLEDLKRKYKKLEIVYEDFLNLASISKRDMLKNEESIGNMLKNINYRAWINLPPVQIFAILPNNARERTFLNYILRSYISFQNVFSVGRTQLFLFVSQNEYQYMTATPDKSWSKYRNFSVLYQTLFDIKLLHVEPRISFFPPLSENQNTKSLCDNMYLVLLSPKKFLLDVLSPNLLPEFGFFVLHHLTKRKGKVIPSLEKWIPNSDLYFLKQGLDMNTQFGELNSTQLLVLFLHFSSMKKYSDSAFRIAAKDDHYFNNGINFEELDELEQEENLIDFERTDT